MSVFFILTYFLIGIGSMGIFLGYVEIFTGHFNLTSEEMDSRISSHALLIIIALLLMILDKMP